MVRQAQKDAHKELSMGKKETIYTAATGTLLYRRNDGNMQDMRKQHKKGDELNTTKELSMKY